MNAASVVQAWLSSRFPKAAKALKKEAEVQPLVGDLLAEAAKAVDVCLEAYVQQQKSEKLAADASVNGNGSSSSVDQEEVDQQKKKNKADATQPEESGIEKPKKRKAADESVDEAPVKKAKSDKKKSKSKKAAEEAESQPTASPSEVEIEASPAAPSHVHPSRLAHINGKASPATDAQNGQSKGKRALNTPFRRVKEEDVVVDPRFADNSYAGMVGSSIALACQYYER